VRKILAATVQGRNEIQVSVMPDLNSFLRILGVVCVSALPS